jgi:hypothetical protein
VKILVVEDEAKTAAYLTNGLSERSLGDVNQAVKRIAEHVERASDR